MPAWSVYLVFWLVLGRDRSEAAARAYFEDVHPGYELVDVHVTNVSPFIPPFWSVSIDSEVRPPGEESAVISAMVLWVEPVTGFTVKFAEG